MRYYHQVLYLVIAIALLNFCAKHKPLPLDKWAYYLIDSTRTGNDIVKGWATFGMDFADGNKDGYGDVVAGKYFYLNPGGDYAQEWKRSILKDSIDNMFIVDVDGDDYADVISLQCNKQYWFEAENEAHTSWKATLIGTEAICNHKTSSMGFCKADIFPGGKPELLFTDYPGKVWCFEIPENPESFWPVVIISENGATEKFISAGDINGDGLLDLATGYKVGDEKHFTGVCWLENPGEKRGNWKRHLVGKVDYTVDHFAIADFNGDGLAEIIVTEGRSPEKYPAGIYLFKANSAHTINDEWTKELIKIQYSTNSLEVADLDLDGDLDFVTGEHKGSCKLQIWENDGNANFTEHVIDSLKESSNGAKLFDMDNDGDLDIATTGWYDHKHVHIWENKAIN